MDKWMEDNPYETHPGLMPSQQRTLTEKKKQETKLMEMTEGTLEQRVSTLEKETKEIKQLLERRMTVIPAEQMNDFARKHHTTVMFPLDLSSK